MTAPRDRAILLAILALGAALRLWGLNGPLWYDEVVTVETHLRQGWGQMLGSYEMNHHYLHNLQARLAMQIAGDAPWVIRLPAFVFGVAGIWAIWALARRLAGTGQAHVAALLVAISYHPIWFSQNARGYTEMAFWGVLGTLVFLRGLDRPRLADWALYAICLAAAIFTHLTGAFLFAAHGLVWLLALALRRGTPVVAPLLAYVAGALLTLALYAPLLPSLVRTLGGVSQTSAVDVMQEYQNPIWTILEGLRTALGASGAPVIAAGLVALVVIVVGALRLDWRFGAIVLAHVVLTVTALLVLGMRVWPRFFYVDINLAMILIAAGVQAIAAWAGPRLFPRWLDAGRAWALAVLAMVAVSLPLTARNYTAPKQDMAGAVAQVKQLRRPGEPVYAVAHAADAFAAHFGVDWRRLDTPAQLSAALAEPGPMIVVVAFPARAFRSLPALAGPDFVQLARLPGTLGDGDIVILRAE